ncbi:TPA: hypothetical protein ACH3X2_007842 [Trebouxia sp. C0005]
MDMLMQPSSKRVQYLRQSLTYPTKVAVGRAFVLNKTHLPRTSKCGYGQIVITAAVQSATLSKSYAQDAASSEAVTPKQLSKYVAELKLSVEGRPVQVCVLGVSHVSRQSCSHVAQIIAAISPEAVLLELCKDRVELLLDPSASPPQHWHTRAIDLQGMSQSSKSACKKLLFKLTCQHGSAFTAHDIEEDCVQLLASGAFESVVPMTQPASMRDAPFFVPGTHQMHPAAPLGSLQFQVRPRNLPPIQSMKLCGSPQSSAESLQHILQTAEAQSHQGIEAADEASITGLEGSATSGKGWGIQPFEPRSQQVPSLRFAESHIVTEERQQIGTSFEPTQWRPWSQQEMDASQASISGRLDAHPSGAVNPFTSFVTQTYAKYQREAGEAVGVASGETWRTAFHAAAQHGASQVHLGDKPAIAMSQQMSQGIWNGTAPYLGAALFLALATLASSATHVLPSALLPVATAVSLGVLSKGLYSVLSPLVEIRQLSRLSPQQIEEAVDLKEPLQNGSKQLVRLWGEDALLSWPGALEPVIHERDVHMAKTIWAAATGTAGSPAFIKTHDGVGQTWKYMMPESAVDLAACPSGHGSGVYKPKEVESVVAIVGSAHVRGIMAELQRMSKQG